MNQLTNQKDNTNTHEIDILFHKIQMPGMFQVIGQEALGKDPYIMHKDIKDVIKL